MPPVIIGCPVDIFATTDQLDTPVSWTEPYAIDDYGQTMLVEANHRPGDSFPVESMSMVWYTFEDDSFNQAQCNFSVIVGHGKSSWRYAPCTTFFIGHKM